MSKQEDSDPIPMNTASSGGQTARVDNTLWKRDADDDNIEKTTPPGISSNLVH